jgi:hypothetical protein
MPECSPPLGLFAWLPFLASVIKLGDQRLDDRVVAMVERCLPAAKSSLAAMFGEGKDLKAAQRLLSNPHVDVLDLREALYACSLESLRRHQARSVVSVFDPTLLDFSAQDWKTDRMPIGDGDGLGYQWLNALLVEPEGGRIYGVGHQVLASSRGLDDRMDYESGTPAKWRAKMRRNHPNQFLVIANAVDSRLPADLEIVHVADREFDDGLVLRARAKARSHFVIRGNDTRVVQVRDPCWLPAELRLGKVQKELDSNPERLTNVRLKDLVLHLPCPNAKTVPLDARGRVCLKPELACLSARLHIGAIAIRLARKSKRGEQTKTPEEPVWLNLVVVRERPTPERPRPLLWLLLTDLPVDTPEQIERVVSFYCRRWRTEEFFRTEKDAMQVEDSELDDARATANLLVFTTFKAMLLDELRFRAEIPAGAPLTNEQRRELKSGATAAKAIELARREEGKPIPALPARQRARMALGLLAYLGGWVGTSLGNYILLRGMPIFVHDVSEGRYVWLLE